jgi:biopolymer transport protein ExbD
MKHRRTREARTGNIVSEALLSMTPMIDVTFLLLIYFVIAFHPTDILAHLGALTPAATPPVEGVKPWVPAITIEVSADGYAMNGKPVAHDQMSELLDRFGAVSADQDVLIICRQDSVHDQLIGVLDACAKARLTRLSVVSR